MNLIRLSTTDASPANIYFVFKMVRCSDLVKKELKFPIPVLKNDKE